MDRCMIDTFRFLRTLQWRTLQYLQLFFSRAGVWPGITSGQDPRFAVSSLQWPRFFLLWLNSSSKIFIWYRYVQVDKLWLYTSSVTDGIVTDACKGDSGGPLILEKGGQPLLIGVLEVTQCESKNSEKWNTSAFPFSHQLSDGTDLMKNGTI